MMPLSVVAALLGASCSAFAPKPLRGTPRRNAKRQSLQMNVITDRPARAALAAAYRVARTTGRALHLPRVLDGGIEQRFCAAFVAESLPPDVTLLPPTAAPCRVPGERRVSLSNRRAAVSVQLTQRTRLSLPCNYLVTILSLSYNYLVAGAV